MLLQEKQLFRSRHFQLRFLLLPVKGRNKFRVLSRCMFQQSEQKLQNPRETPSPYAQLRASQGHLLRALQFPRGVRQNHYQQRALH